MKDLKENNYWSVYNWQLANHFPEKKALATKAGLTETLAPDAGVRFQADIDPETFFPLSFNLNASESVQQFLEEVGVGNARGLLRAGLDAKLPVNRAIWKAALSINKHAAVGRDIDALLDEPEHQNSVSDLDWHLVHLGQQLVEPDDANGEGQSQALCQLFSKLDLRAAPKSPFPRPVAPSVRTIQRTQGMFSHGHSHLTAAAAVVRAGRCRTDQMGRGM